MILRKKKNLRNVPNEQDHFWFNVNRRFSAFMLYCLKQEYVEIIFYVWNGHIKHPFEGVAVNFNIDV